MRRHQNIFVSKVYTYYIYIIETKTNKKNIYIHIYIEDEKKTNKFTVS